MSELTDLAAELERVRARALVLSDEQNAADASIKNLRQARPALVAAAATDGGAADDALIAADDTLRQAVAARRAAEEQHTEASSRVMQLELQYAKLVVEGQLAGLPAFETATNDALADLADTLSLVSLVQLEPGPTNVIRDFHLQNAAPLSDAIQQAILALVARILKDPGARPSVDCGGIRATLGQLLVEIDKREARRAERLERQRAQSQLDAVETTRLTGQ